MEFYFVRLIFIPATLCCYLFSRLLISSPYNKIRKKMKLKVHKSAPEQKEIWVRWFFNWLWYTDLHNKTKEKIFSLNKIASGGVSIIILSHALLGWIAPVIPFLRYIETLGYIAQIPFMCRALAIHYKKRYGTALFLFRRSENNGVDSSLFNPLFSLFPTAMACSLWFI